MRFLSEFTQVAGRLRMLKKLTLRMNAKYDVEVFFFPSRTLERPALEELQDDLRAIAAGTVDDLPAYGIFSEDTSKYDNRIITIIRDRGEARPVACSAMVHFRVDPRQNGLGGLLAHGPQDVFHLGLVLINKAYQRQHLQFQLYAFTNLVILAANYFKPVWVSSVSAHPAIVGAVAENYHRVFPTFLETGVAPKTHLALAQALFERREEFGTGTSAIFEPGRFVIRDSFNEDSRPLKTDFEGVAKYRDDRCNDYCRSNLDYDRGDEVFQIGQVHALRIFAAGWRLARRYFSRT